MMKNLALILIVLIFSCNLNAQNVTPVETLHVTGESKIFQTPDLLEMYITISTKEKEYETCLKKNLDEVNILKRKIKSVKIDQLEIKDISQRVNQEFIYDRGKSTPNGYKSTYQLVVKTPANPKAVHQLMKAVRESGVQSNYTASYKLSPSLLKASETKMIEEAVKDAMFKAKMLSKASGVSLGSIVKINYGSQGFQSGPIMYKSQAMLRGPANSADESFSEPDAIVLSDHVNITWELK